MTTLKKLIPVEVEYDISPDDLVSALRSFPEKHSIDTADRILDSFTSNPKLTDAGRKVITALLNKHLKALKK